MSDSKGFPPSSFQGSTKFYDSIQTDEFTPSADQIGLLDKHVGEFWEVGKDEVATKYPPWIVATSKKSPAEQYVEWFNGIWHTGDPSSWNEHVFTDDAVMIDPSGRSTGAKEAAASFLLLFKYFPGLRGLVVSWASNDREIIINWRFQILRKGDKAPFLVPVIDKFCFWRGRVSFRLANYDILTLLGYLSQTYGVDQLLDFLAANSKQATKTGGIQRLPGIAFNLLSGLFYWPHPTQTGLEASIGKGVVKLTWTAIEDETLEAYRVSRSENLDGDYKPLPQNKDKDPKDLTYEDENLFEEISSDPNVAPRTESQWISRFLHWLLHWDRTTTYWYSVSPVVAKSVSVPVEKGRPIIVSQSRKKRLASWGYSLEE